MFELVDIGGQKVVVTCQFLLECQNVTRQNILEARNLYNRGSTKYIRLTPGSIVQKEREERPLMVVPVSNKLPSIIFQNDDKQKEGARCLPYSLAKGLLHLGYLSEAMGISASVARDLEELGDMLTLDKGVKIQSRSVFIGKDRYDPLVDHHQLENPVVAVVQGIITGEDGKSKNVAVNHCLCFVEICSLM